MLTILGIVNVTRDSFSDGGRFLSPAAAIAHAGALLDGGADVIDVGAESTHPDAEDVDADEEIARLTPVITALRADGVRISVDTRKPQVMRHALALGAEFINDVHALRDSQSVAAVRDADARLILMHSRSAAGRAERVDSDPRTIVEQVLDYFRRRIDELAAAGIRRERLILDPGMGFFVGRDPRVSLALLRGLDRLANLGCARLVCTSRKSFIGALLDGPVTPRPPQGRAAGTLATELWVAAQGVEYIRTHDPAALRDAWRLWRAIENE